MRCQNEDSKTRDNTEEVKHWIGKFTRRVAEMVEDTHRQTDTAVNRELGQRTHPLDVRAEGKIICDSQC